MKSYAELRFLRLKMKFSIGEMAAVLNVPKATYQGYEAGRRSMPNGFIDKVLEWKRRDSEFMAGIGKRCDEQLRSDGMADGIPGAAIDD